MSVLTESIQRLELAAQTPEFETIHEDIATVLTALENALTTVSEDLIYQRKLEAAQALAEEPEYEYRVRDAKGRIWKTATAGARPGDVLVRRRKPDAWEEVPS